MEHLDLNKIDIQIERYVINKFMSMPKLFDKLDIDYDENTTMFCPFHKNTHTKAAKLYNDVNGWSLWCFSEQKMFGAYDIYKEFLPKVDTHKLAVMLLKRLPPNEQEQIIKESGDILELQELPFQSSLTKFKEHNIKYRDLINQIILELEKGE